MEILFLVGIISGFFLGVLFATFFTQIVTHRMVAILKYNAVAKFKEDDDDDENEDDEANDPVNYWKPKGWKPNDEN